MYTVNRWISPESQAETVATNVLTFVHSTFGKSLDGMHEVLTNQSEYIMRARGYLDMSCDDGVLFSNCLSLSCDYHGLI